MRILLAEDEKVLAKAIVKILEKNNYSVDAVYDGEDALTYLQAGAYDLAILDLMMPKLDGLTALKRYRADGGTIPVLILTAKSEIEDRVAGLDGGANDYLTKPFDTRELLARIRVLTRGKTETDSKFVVGNTTLDRTKYELATANGSFRLANKEYQIMELFMSNPGQVITSERIMEKIWGFESESEINVVWVYISYLRRKLTALQSNIQIKALRNVGYSLEADNDKQA